MSLLENPATPFEQYDRAYHVDVCVWPTCTPLSRRLDAQPTVTTLARPALGLPKVHVLGFSIGRLVAQQIAVPISRVVRC
jgi:hypothetical protein